MKFLEKNESMQDRLIRGVVGVILLAAFVLNYLPYPWDWVAAVIGAIGLITAATGSCVIYSLVGWNTLRKGAAKAAAKARPKRKRR